MVKPNLDGRITADVTRHTLCKNLSKEDALRFIRIEMIEEGDTIRIVTRPTHDMPKNNYAKTGTYIEVSTTVEITVPDGALLDLRTGVGSIWVVGRPNEIRSKNEIGAVGFELDSTRGTGEHAGESPWLRLESPNGGEASVDFDGTRYRYSGITKPVP